LVEAFDLVPDFLEDLAAHDLLEAFAGGIIGVELLCQIALERSIPDVGDVLTAGMAAGFGGRFEQVRLRDQGTDLPALPMLVHRGDQQAQSVDLFRHRLVADEVPLIEVVEFIQEELHVAGLFWSEPSGSPLPPRYSPA